NWAVSFTGELHVLSFEAAEVSGLAFLPNQASFLDSRIQKLYELPPGTAISEDLIPITTQAHYDALVHYGGTLITFSLRAPKLLIDPAAQLAKLPPAPDGALE